MLNKLSLNKIENKVSKLKQRASYTYMKDEIVIMCLILRAAYPFLLYDSLMHMLTKYAPNSSQ